MNERIQELLKQATKEVDPYDRVWVFSKVDQAKFAELIVRECAGICFSEARGHNMAFGEHCGIIIKEHFGILD